MSITISQIADLLQGCIVGDRSISFTGVAQAQDARPGDLTFAESETFFRVADASDAAAILIDGAFSSTRKTLIRVPNARQAFARVLPLFFPEKQYPAGIHPSAIIAASAQVDGSAHIGPYCVVGDRVRIGARTVLVSQVNVADDTEIGDDAILFPLVAVYAKTRIGHRVRIHAGAVLGSDGFGYVFDQGKHRKVPQVGNLVIHDDVEIGANATIDRGALGSTVIGKGCKIDNLVQIAHNVELGENSVIVAQVGIAGSTKLGSYVTIAGQAGLADHLNVGHRVTIGAKAGVMHDIPDGEKWLGIPAGPERHTKRQLIAIQQLPGLIRRVHELEKRLLHEEQDQKLRTENSQEHG
jgi:UDP-3-O-[3-hydroxymyristoyl] glucosamine N-acyltransferase